MKESGAMGMAASQARWLGLTARKTNVEYEGQQVNQARTALANECAQTFQDLIKLEVPVAPSTRDFTTMEYSYTDGLTKETITKMTPLTNDPDGYNYMVSHYHYSDIFTGIQSKLANPQVSVDAGVPKYIGNSTVLAYDASDPVQKASYDEFVKNWPESKFAQSSAIYTWSKNGQAYFACEEDLLETAASAPDATKPLENQQKLMQYYAQDVKTKIELKDRAMVGLDDAGRPETIRYEDSSAVFPLAVETITDDRAYEDAMNQYKYNMEVYEKQIQDINAKTKRLQEQDRTLELRLRQLDTEQEALQTEMEAVKKVIDKNIESTFKTFE